MKAIITKYIPASNTRGSRIKATANGVPSITIPYPYDESGILACHKIAAKMLCEKYNWQGELIAGDMPDETGFAFCFQS